MTQPMIFGWRTSNWRQRGPVPSFLPPTGALVRTYVGTNFSDDQFIDIAKIVKIELETTRSRRIKME